MINKIRSAVLAGTAVVAITLGAGSANAATATANSYATIVSPLTIAEDAALRFGIIVPAAIAGSVTITPGGAQTCTNVSCVTTGSTHSAGQFTLTGAGGSAVNYQVSAPTTLTGPGTAMAVSGLTVSGTGSGTLSAGASGTLAFTVGATLAVGASQAAGSYSGSYTVTANYN